MTSSLEDNAKKKTPESLIDVAIIPGGKFNCILPFDRLASGDSASRAAV